MFCCSSTRTVSAGSRVPGLLLLHGKPRTATELEPPALIWALETFCPNTKGANEINRTDDAALGYTKSKNSKCRRLEGWALPLQAFRFTLQPRPGSQRKHVGALSRAPIPAELGQQRVELDMFPDPVMLPVAPPALAPLVSETQFDAFRRSYLQGFAVRAVRQRREPATRNPRWNVPRPDGGEGSDSGLCGAVLSEDDERAVGGAAAQKTAQTSEREQTLAQRSSNGNVANPLGANDAEQGAKGLAYEDCPAPPPGPIALPATVHRGDLLAAQQSDKDRARFRPLVFLPKVEWFRTWASARLRYRVSYS